jgi:2-polyprenyl-3-methyl-5-hydroxy-6-metoxy-1,4-benzoquinol methylase
VTGTNGGGGTGERTPFATVDDMPPHLQDLLLDALARMATTPQIKRVREVATAALDPRPGERLLDAGCGVGEVARELAAAVAPGGAVVAVDASATTVAAAQARHDGSAVRYEVADVLALPYADGEFDAVRTERVLQHVQEPDAAIAELARVTRPGGRVCLVDTDWQSLAVDGLPEDLVESVLAAFRARDLLHHQSMGRTLRRRLVRAGLDDVRAEPVPLLFTSAGGPDRVLPMFNREIPPEAHLVPAEARDRWFDAVDAAVASGEFLAVLTMWVAVGSPRG